MGLADDMRKVAKDVNDVQLQREIWIKEKIKNIVSSITKEIKIAAQKGKNDFCGKIKAEPRANSDYDAKPYGDNEWYLKNYYGQKISNVYCPEERKYCTFAHAYVPSEDQDELARSITKHFQNEGFSHCNIQFREIFDIKESGIIIKRKTKVSRGYRELFVEISW